MLQGILFCPADGRAGVKKEKLQMFQTKLDECGFTLLTSGLMIYIMGVYNAALHTGGLQYSAFGMAAHSFPMEWLVGFLLAFFVASRTAKHFAFKVAQPSDRPIFKILCIQTFTVCTMVPLMSLLGTLEFSGITAALPVVWLQTVALNFVMAYPLQIFAVGPFCRFVFRRRMGARPHAKEEEEQAISEEFAGESHKMTYRADCTGNEQRV